MSAILGVALSGIGLLVMLGACLAPLALPTPNSPKVFIRQLSGVVLSANVGALVTTYAAGGNFWIYALQYSGYITFFAATAMILRNALAFFHRIITVHPHEARGSDILHHRPRAS